MYLRSLGDMQGAQAAEMLKLAIGEYETIAKLKPDDIETKLLLGQLYGLNHESGKAEAQFKEAQKLDSNSEEVVLNMARLYGEQGDAQRAADTLSAVPQEDRSARVEFALGASYDMLKKPKDAAAAYKRSLDLEPDNPDAERGLANALLLDNQLDRGAEGLYATWPRPTRRTRSRRSISLRLSVGRGTMKRRWRRCRRQRRSSRIPLT